jgi:hypothetical protein
MIDKEYIVNHSLFVKYKELLLSELQFRKVNINNIDELMNDGIDLVLNVDGTKSKHALEYITFYADIDIQTMFKVFIGKELSQIIYLINDVEDSVKDYFGWVTLAIILGVSI